MQNETGLFSKIAHKSFKEEWEQAMRYGLIGGRPFSDKTIGVYTYYVDWYFKRYDEISIANLKQALMSIDPIHHTKRLKIYQAVISLAKIILEQEQIDNVFFEKVKSFRPRQHLPVKRITVEEGDIQKLIACCDQAKDRMIVILLYQTGLRVTEAAKLKLADIDMEKKVLTVQLAKWGKTRRVGMTNMLMDELLIYLPHREELGTDHLFYNHKGKPIDRYGIRVRLSKLGRKAGVKVTPHSLRRAFVTINANKGRPLPMLQIACGHSDITTTRSYCMTTEAQAIEAMQSWD